MQKILNKLVLNNLGRREGMKDVSPEILDLLKLSTITITKK
jgi:hypothetical protein